jgi:NhaP-type Na+/H+ and K+/H+ antiporter
MRCVAVASVRQVGCRLMSDVEHFALILLVVAVAITAAVLSNRISERIRVPAPVIFLVDRVRAG